MATIRERAKEWAQTRSYNRHDMEIAYEEYIKGATDQQKIDIEKACGILAQWGYGALTEDFRKAMEESL